MIMNQNGCDHTRINAPNPIQTSKLNALKQELVLDSLKIMVYVADGINALAKWNIM